MLLSRAPRRCLPRGCAVLNANVTDTTALASGIAILGQPLYGKRWLSHHE